MPVRKKGVTKQATRRKATQRAAATLPPKILEQAKPAPPAPPLHRTTPVFDASKLDRTVIALPLVERFKSEEGATEVTATAQPMHPVVIDLNLDYKDGRAKAREEVIQALAEIVLPGTGPKIRKERAEYAAMLRENSPMQYVAARLTQSQISAVVQRDVALGEAADTSRNARRIYRIWPDFEVSACLTRSVMTIKADAARVAFNARGRDIVWAVMDSGIQGDHPHFERFQNLAVKLPIAHMSFLGVKGDNPLVDAFGHGTHVAGIIGGCLATRDSAAATDLATEVASKKAGSKPRSRKSSTIFPPDIYSAHGVREGDGDTPRVELRPIGEISGVAPECKLVSMKVLDENGYGRTTAIISALQKVHDINQQGRRLLIHGVNLSLGYDFDPEWFGCGQSPLCVEVDRLVRSGVSVVVAAGNSGYGFQNTAFTKVKAAGLPLTINDPGNAEAAITVGSTHRDMPHLYGASYFSSKGPTGDGRNKPDVLAPGEKIVSCAAGSKKASLLARERSRSSPAGVAAAQVQYVEDSGTSMAAPHVSGAIAAFLSVRREFQGRAEEVKALFLDNATDLKRDRYFQGRGLIDLMRTIQSV